MDFTYLFINKTFKDIYNSMLEMSYGNFEIEVARSQW
jgi:hypothetical protein